jgi:hypothetical protein
MKQEFSEHPHISFEFEGNEIPPEKYIVTFSKVKGLRLKHAEGSENRELEIVDEHKIEIYLHADYPRLKPQCNLITGAFHPNFRMAVPNDICIGDYWASGETLVDIIYQVGDMITYQNYNVSSPLNGIAAKWAKENIELFPIDNVNLRQGEVEINFIDKKSNE